VGGAFIFLGAVQITEGPPQTALPVNLLETFTYA
jgi:hypothetical protein